MTTSPPLSGTAAPDPERDADLDDILRRLDGPDRARLDRLLPSVYQELKTVAHRCLAGEYASTMNTTSLVHEAYIQLSRQHSAAWQDRRHFLALSAIVMRRLIVSHARNRLRQKRGGHAIKVDLDEALTVFSDDSAEQVVRLDELIERLNQISDRARRVVECRFYAGLTVEETAEALGVSPVTVKRDWLTARAWLKRELDGLDESR